MVDSVDQIIDLGFIFVPHGVAYGVLLFTSERVACV